MLGTLDIRVLKNYNKIRAKAHQTKRKEYIKMNKLVRFDPFAEMDALQRRFFNDDGWMPRQMRSVGLPTTDVYLKDNSLVVEAHLPNFNEDDVNISVEHGNLVIQAERQRKRRRQEEEICCS